MNPITKRLLLLVAALSTSPALAASGPSIAGIPIDYILFGLTLLGVALLHGHTLHVAASGAIDASQSLPDSSVAAYGITTLWRLARGRIAEWCLRER